MNRTPRSLNRVVSRGYAAALVLLSISGCDLGPTELDEVAKLVDGEGGAVLAAARTPGDEAGDPDNTFFRYHVTLHNPGNDMLVLNAGTQGLRINGTDQASPFEFDQSQESQTSPYYDSEPDDLHLFPGESDTYKFQHLVLGDAIDGAGFQFNYEGSNDVTRLAWAVEAYENTTSTGGYPFPTRNEDLHPGEFWSQGTHSHARHQAYALDLGVRRWRNGSLTSYTEEAFDDQANGIDIGSRNEHFGIWGKPVYAMHGGTILKCRRLRPDHPPGAANSESGANLVTVDHGNGEVASYVHLMDRSTPAHLCPTEISGNDYLDPPIQIEEGQFLGRVGNSGPSTGPHLHLAISDTDHTASQSRTLPINFGQIAVHGSSSYQQGDDLNEVSFGQPKAMGPHQILKPNISGWPEADLALGHQYTQRDGSFCATREGGQDRIRVDLEPSQFFDARNVCNLSAEVEVTTHANWTIDIDAHERSGEGRTLLMSSYNGGESRKRNMALDWVKLRDGSSYVYVISLRRIDANTVETWTLHGSGHLLIDVNKNSMTFSYGSDQASTSIGFVGVGSTKRASLHAWEAQSNLL